MMHFNDWDTSDVEILTSVRTHRNPPPVPLRALNRLAHLRAVEVQLNASNSVVR